MDPHLFRVGQMVTIDSLANAAHCRGAMRRYKVLCLLPPINGSHAYRVKAIMEAEPRVAMESQCSITGVPQPVFCLNDVDTRPAASSDARTDKVQEKDVNSSFIRVTQRQDHLWSVVRGLDGEKPLTFRLKAHAVAYGRALSYSGKLTLFVDDQRGIAVRQDPSSVTYPRSLN